MARSFTPVNASHVLLLEGDDDKYFFNKLCVLFNLNPDIKVAVPKDFNSQNSKGGVFESLPPLLKQLADGSLSKLAVIVDADYEEQHGLGYQKTIQKITDLLTLQDFVLIQNAENHVTGLIFENGAELANFGLWVMPNNQNSGMLEDFVKTCIKTDELSLFNHAQQVVHAISEPKFKPHHYAKAEVATWLAWQKQPGHGLYCAVKDDLLNTDHALFQELAHWLKKIFI
jgi:hypothetical protein